MPQLRFVGFPEKTESSGTVSCKSIIKSFLQNLCRGYRQGARIMRLTSVQNCFFVVIVAILPVATTFIAST